MCKCGPTFCKGLFIIVNTFLLVIAIVLAATAGYVAFQRSDVRSLIASTNDHGAFVGLYLLMISGILMGIATIIGYIGAIKESKGLLIIYFYCIAFLLILEIAGIALCFTKYHHLRKEIRHMLHAGTSTKVTSLMTQYYFREVQIHRKCCGWDGPSDYELAVPDACRKTSHGVFFFRVSDVHSDTGVESNSELGTGEESVKALPAAPVIPKSTTTTLISTSTTTSTTSSFPPTSASSTTTTSTVATSPTTVAASPTTAAKSPTTAGISKTMAPTTLAASPTTVATSPTTVAVTTTTTERTPPAPITIPAAVNTTVRRVTTVRVNLTSVPPKIPTTALATNTSPKTAVPVVSGNYYQEGCEARIKPMFIIPAGIGITTMILQLLGMIFSCCLLAEIKRGYGPLA